MDIDGVMFEIYGLNSFEGKACALVVGLLGVDVVPVGHGALGRVEDGRHAHLFQQADAHCSRAERRGGKTLHFLVAVLGIPLIR